MEIPSSISAKAFIICNKTVLLLRESQKYLQGTNPGKFDVVGGRIYPGENIEKGLIREIGEETGLEVKIGLPFSVNQWKAIINGEEQNIFAVYFECFSQSKEVNLSEEHEEYIWIDPRAYLRYEIIKDLSKAFVDYLGKY